MTLIQKALGLILVTGGGIAGYTYLTSSNKSKSVKEFEPASIRENGKLKKYLKKQDKTFIEEDKIKRFETFFEEIDSGSKKPRTKEKLSFISNI